LIQIIPHQYLADVITAKDEEESLGGILALAVCLFILELGV